MAVSMDDGDDDGGGRLALLLADAEERRPVLDGGLPREAAERAPRPKRARRSAESFQRRRVDADPNDLALQRWGVVAPEGRAGDRLLDAIKPLLRLREEEQGEPPMIYRVPPDMDARTALDWRDDVYWSERVSEEDRPLYLLFLGDLDQVSAELQHTLANGALVGRVHFADAAGDMDLRGYAAYAEKVVRFARDATSDDAADLLFYVARDGTPATRAGETKLVLPSLTAARQVREKGQLAATDVRSITAETVDELFAGGSASRPSVLLSVSHGLGAPRRGFRSEEEQRRTQGALVLGRDEVLTAERLEGQRFLPGGMWVCGACFGAGTPASSAYYAWLSELAAEGAYGGAAKQVLHSLPKAGQRPFIAAMPQAALANPEGPLAVVGHLDLAWTYGFTSAKDLSESRKTRMLAMLTAMVRGGRAGVSLSGLLQFYRETNDALMTSYQLEMDAKAEGRPYTPDRAQRGNLWMLRNDLRGYVLLGDPAARLPLKQYALRPAVPSSPARPSKDQAAVRREAVAALLRGDEAPREVAARAGASLDELWSWLKASWSGD